MITKSTKIDTTIQRTLMEVLLLYPPLLDVVQRIHEAGGRILLVGGAVRDLFLHMPCKDLDLEVYGLTVNKLESILQTVGEVFTVGKAFGVLRVAGIDADWSLPRCDSAGRKPTVETDPFMSYAKAFKRRDLTINALGIDLMTFELIDPFHGLQDMRNGILSCPDERLFVEDPLRFYRVMQFIARFGMWPDERLTQLCATMDIRSISRERIEAEFQKLMLQGQPPSAGFRWLKTINRLHEVLPELALTIGVSQDPRWHKEGDVFEHTMQALDAAALFAYPDPEDRLVLRYAALCHDLGKATTTVVHEDGTITSYGHELDSVTYARSLLPRMMSNKIVIERVLILVRHHMKPLQFIKGKAQATAYKRLARMLGKQVTMSMLADLACSDVSGRNPEGNAPLPLECEMPTLFKQKAAAARVIFQAEPAVLHGRDILDSIAPGPLLGRALEYAYQVQIKDNITDKDELKKRVLEKYRKNE